MFGTINRKKRISGVLSEHAEALIHGQDQGPDLLEEYPDDARQLEGFFDLAGRLATIGTPVEPPPAFVDDLKTRLYEIQVEEQARRALWRERRQKAMRLSAALGLIISVVALLALFARLLYLVIRTLGVLAARRGRNGEPA